MSGASHRKPARKTMQRVAHAVVWCLAVVASTLPVLGGHASAAPSDLPDPRLPVVVPAQVVGHRSSRSRMTPIART